MMSEYKLVLAVSLPGMEKQQELRRGIKEKLSERRKKLRKAIVRHKEDFLTALEKNWRDASLRPITTLLWKCGITANMIGWFSVLLLLVAIWMYFKDYPFSTQLILLTIVALIDGLDGPLARNNNNVTVHGVWLDHLRDAALVAWASVLIYTFGLLSAQNLIILWSLQFILAWLLMKDFLIQYLRGVTEEDGHVAITKFSLSTLQATLVGRIQFAVWALSYGFLLGSLVLSIPYLETIGQILFLLAIIFAALNVLEAQQKSAGHHIT